MKKDQSFIVSREDENTVIQFSPHHLNSQDLHYFQTLIYEFHDQRGRSLPWRDTDNPYHILVSEFMLQQTQTQRVRKKYEQFLSRFPDMHSLAHASLEDILSVWQGLGYNRRALFLKETARLISTRYETVPSDPAILSTFPGIGPATAGAIAAYAFNVPSVFVETNIRTVFIHFFFSGEEHISDTLIMPLVEETLDRTNPRTWYYALTDYGVWLKKTHRNPGRRSAHHQFQSPFKGSDREIRGAILKLLLAEGEIPVEILMKRLPFTTSRIQNNCYCLEKEGFIIMDNRSGTPTISISP